MCLHAKFRWFSIHGWDKTTSGFDCCLIVVLRYNSASACQISSKSTYPWRRYDVMSIFSRWRPAAILYLIWVISGHLRRVIIGLSSVLKFGLDPIHKFGDMAIYIFRRFGLKLPIPAHFWEFWGHISRKIWNHCSNPQKHHPCAKTRCLRSVQRYDLGARSWEKKVRTVRQKSQSGNISPIWGEAPTAPFAWWVLRRRNHVCKVSQWYFHGLRFYRGSNFPCSYWFLHGPYNSAALLRCLW